MAYYICIRRITDPFVLAGSHEPIRSRRETRVSRLKANFGPQPGELDLPPGFEAVTLRELGDAFVHARKIAAEGGAGTLVWVRRLDVVELAVVLEPDEPLSTARRAIYAVLDAAADALAAAAPPETPITLRWPDTVLIDGGILGGARLGWPDRAAEHAVPDWLVAGLVLRNVAPHVRVDTAVGGHPLDEPLVRGASLASAGFERLDGATLVSSFARHLMVQADRWQQDGFEPIGRDFLARLETRKGELRGLDADGGLLVRQMATARDVVRHDLHAALTAGPRWMDPRTQEPWL